MIYLFSALYWEASIFIKQFHLEKKMEHARFQVFYNETADLCLTITGTGEIAAATAVGIVCTEFRPNEGDILLNIGTCAHPQGQEGVYLCHKIIEQATGKTYYPDLLYRHNFRETALVTGILPWNRGTDSTELCTDVSGEALYDMEAAAIYQAGSYFFGPHQMIFLKVVSDPGTAREVSKKQVMHCMETNQDRLFDFVAELHGVAHENRRNRDGFSLEKTAWLEKLCADLHCSKAMQDSLGQYIRYLELAGVDYIPVIQDLYGKGLLPCKDKREGKLRFEEIKKRFF